MKYFNKEQIERLKEAELHFQTVTISQWKRGTTREMNDLIADVYEEATGNKISRNWGCSTCVYNAYLTVGKLYYESIKQLEKEEQVVKELEPAQETNELEAPVTNKAKRGRPRKMSDYNYGG